MIGKGFYSHDPSQLQDHIFWLENSCYKCGLFHNDVYIPDIINPKKDKQTYTCSRCQSKWTIDLDMGKPERIQKIDDMVNIAHERNHHYEEFQRLDKIMKKYEK